MIDLHCHILPGVDDGPTTPEEALAMARVAIQDGLHTIVATPHGAEGVYSGRLDDTVKRLDAFGSFLSSHGVQLKLLPGLEVYLTPKTPSLCREGAVYPLNSSRYLLVEFSVDMVPPYVEQALFELQLQGLVPIIAHPERNMEIAAAPEKLERMVRKGMLAQVTAGSITGEFGGQARAAAEAMLSRGLVQIIASDAHAATRRPPRMSGAVRRAAQLVGEEAAESMVEAVPAAILANEDVEPPEPRPTHKGSWFAFGRRR
ncbi:MAG TPA: CpsB/CapC family capsule biosynthesis tyrosine phosphatase [Chloroflexota bacterium]|nr:CpsB/CapC family capsule biosynthesis tyrosine phosphatase [Chloroflexota bacterium]